MKSSASIMLDIFICANGLHFCIEHLNVPYGWVFILPVLMYGVCLHLTHELMEGRAEHFTFLKRQMPIGSFVLACIGAEELIKAALTPKNQGLSIVIGLVGLAMFAYAFSASEKIESD